MKKIKKVVRKIKNYFYQEFWKENRALMILLLIILALVVLVRVRYLAVPFDRDEGEYAYMGQLILQGHLPYEEAYNLKLPGTYFVFALIMLIFGQTHLAVHFGLLLTIVATALFLLLFFKKITTAKISIIATTFFLLMSVSYPLQGIFARAEHFVIFFASAGLWLLNIAFDKNSKKMFFFGGLFLSLAFIMKQHGFFLVLFGLIYVIQEFYSKWKAKRWDKKEIKKNAGFYIVGSLFPLLLLFSVYLLKGELDLLWYWSFAYAREHLSILEIRFGLEYLRNNFSLISIIHPFQVLFFFVGLLVALLKIKEGKHWLVLSFALLSFLCVVPGFYFSKYYFVMFLPGLCLLAGVGAVYLTKKISNKENFGKILLMIVLTASLYSVLRQSDYLFDHSPVQASRLIFGYNPFPEALTIANHLRENTEPSDRIAVLGSEPEIFFYSKRRSATGFLYMYTLMDDQKYAHQMQNQMIQEIESNDPKFVVFIGVDTSWRHSRHTGEILLNWYPKFLKEKYDLVGISDSYAPDRTEYVWGEEASNYEARSKHLVWIYQRKTSQ